MLNKVFTGKAPFQFKCIVSFGALSVPGHVYRPKAGDEVFSSLDSKITEHMGNALFASYFVAPLMSR